MNRVLKRSRRWRTLLLSSTSSSRRRMHKMMPVFVWLWLVLQAPSSRALLSGWFLKAYSSLQLFSQNYQVFSLCMPLGVIINKTGKSSYFPVAERWKLWETVSHSCSWKRYWNLLSRISSFSPIYVQFHFKSRELMSFVFTLLEINCWIHLCTAKAFDSVKLGIKGLFSSVWNTKYKMPTTLKGWNVKYQNFQSYI